MRNRLSISRWNFFMTLIRCFLNDLNIPLRELRCSSNIRPWSEDFLLLCVVFCASLYLLELTEQGLTHVHQVLALLGKNPQLPLAQGILGLLWTKLGFWARTMRIYVSFWLNSSRGASIRASCGTLLGSSQFRLKFIYLLRMQVHICDSTRILAHLSLDFLQHGFENPIRRPQSLGPLALLLLIDHPPWSPISSVLFHFCFVSLLNLCDKSFQLVRGQSLIVTKTGEVIWYSILEAGLWVFHGRFITVCPLF